MACRDEQARPRLDDQVSLGSYRSDAYTLPCDPIEDETCSEVSHDSYDSYCREEPLPSYRVPKEQGVSQPVYEAWIIYCTDKQDTIQKTTFCGLPVCRHYAESRPYAACITEPHTQDNLSAMARSAVDGYQATHKRSFPSRLLCGRPKSYEADLDARIQKLPRQVQFELDTLLGDREAATGNRFHKRDWTVAMMREQYRYRFASAEYEEVKKGGKRFWKRGSAKRPSEYFFVIRGGGEGAQVAPEDDDKGQQTATRHGNPWKRVDEAEEFRKQNARDVRRYGKNYERLRVQVRGRSPSLRRRDRSPSPPPRRVRLESEGPAVPTYRFPNPFTPSPHFAVPPTPHSFPHPHALSWGSFPPSGPCPPPPPPPPPTYPSAYNFPDLTFSRLPPPPPPPPPMPPMPHIVRESTRYPYVSNPYAGTALADFDFDSFLRDEVTVPPQYTGPSPAPSPPPAPRLSNLTTPTTFSPASSAHSSGSSVDGTEVSTPVDAVSLELRVGGEGSVFGG